MNSDKNIRKSALFKTPLLIVVLLILTSCGFILTPLKKDEVRSFSLRGAEFENALALSARAAEDLHFNIETRNKKTGTFEANRGYGLGEITLLFFRLQKGYKRKLYFTVIVKSSKDSATVMDEFIVSLNKYLDILPMMPENQ